MSTNNSTPINWDNENSDGLFDSLFPSGFDSGSFYPSFSSGYSSPFVTAQNIEKGSYIKDDTPVTLLENVAEDNSLVYNVVLCPAGSDVLETYEKTIPKSNQLIMFCEQVPPEKSNLFGTFVLVKFGEKYRSYLEKLRQKKQAVNSRRKNSNMAYRIDSFEKEVADDHSILTNDFGATVDIEKVRFALESELNITSSSGVMLKNIFGGIEDGINFVFDGLSDLIEEVKFTEEDYVPQKNEGEYSFSDYLEKLIELQVEAVKTAVDYAIPDSVEKFISESFESAISNIKGFIKKNLPESWLKILKKIYGIVQEALEFFKTGYKKISELIGEAALLLKSLLMGFVNGLLSTIQTLLKVIGWLLVNLSGINGYKKLTGEYYREFQSKLEFIEDLFDLIGEKSSEFFGAVLNLVLDFSLENIKSVLKVFVGKAESLTPYHYAYFAGSFIFEVVLAVVLAIFTGGATAVAQAASFAEKVTAMLRLIAKEAISTATMGVLDILKLFKILITKFVQACKNGWKGFKQFLENLLANKADDVIKDEGKVLDNAFDQVEFLNGFTREIILSTKRGKRPLPIKYLSSEYIENHLKKFDEGAVRFTTKSSFKKHGTLGPDGGFIIPKKDFDAILQSNDDVSIIEKKLGLNEGDLSNDDLMIAFIEKQDFEQIRMPSGNEGGANEKWLPGGYTSGNLPEAVMDLSKKINYKELKLK